MFRRGHADADGTGQHPLIVDAENPGIRQIVKTIADLEIRIGLDCPLIEVGIIAQAVNSVLFSFSFRQAIVDLVKQFDAALERAAPALGLMDRIHRNPTL